MRFISARFLVLLSAFLALMLSLVRMTASLHGASVELLAMVLGIYLVAFLMILGRPWWFRVRNSPKHLGCFLQARFGFQDHKNTVTSSQHDRSDRLLTTVSDSPLLPLPGALPRQSSSCRWREPFAQALRRCVWPDSSKETAWLAWLVKFLQVFNGFRMALPVVIRCY